LKYDSASSKTLFFHILRHLYYNFLSGRHTFMIFRTHVPFPQLFAKGKSLKSEGIGMPRDKNKGLHGDLGYVEPTMYSSCNRKSDMAMWAWGRLCEPEGVFESPFSSNLAKVDRWSAVSNAQEQTSQLSFNLTWLIQNGSPIAENSLKVRRVLIGQKWLDWRSKWHSR
jgi:hypothetical protein